jgi:HNH endonuclease
LISERIEQNIVRIPEAGCWIWMKSVGSHGYGQIMFKDHKPRLVHRLTYEEYVGPIPTGLHVLHRCDTRSCCNPSHLFVGTAKDNMQDCKKKGRNSPPPIGANSKLSIEQRQKIVELWKRGIKPTVLAKDNGVSLSRVHQIVRPYREY